MFGQGESEFQYRCKVYRDCDFVTLFPFWVADFTVHLLVIYLVCWPNPDEQEAGFAEDS
jgi:hypothetical protein